MSILTERIQERMNELKLSQADLAELTGISKPSISQYLSGKNEPRLDKIKKIAEVLLVSENWLSGVEEDGMQSTKYRMSVAEAAEIMCVSKVFVRFGLIDKRLPFGAAVKMSNRYSFYISPKLFYEFVGSREDAKK